ncbi:flagellar hook-length control protein FliK [Chitinibacteraceae bacterium HSL-7]
MLPGEAPASLLQLYVKAQQGLVQVMRPTPDEALRFTAGERVQAFVSEQLPTGRFAVLVKDQLLDLNLPRNTQAGDQLELMVVARQPKLTFSIVPPSAQQTAPGAELSPAARMLASLLTGKSASVPTSLAPLIPESPDEAATQGSQQAAGAAGVARTLAPPDTSALAAKLATALSESGLFYESHQAKWVSGERTLVSLLREPQANLHQTAKPSEAETRTGLGVISTRSSDALAPEAHAQLRGLVERQLDTLESRPMVWQGLAWPGQPLRWEVEPEYDAERNEHDADAIARWATELKLDLPRLGAIRIRASLSDQYFSLRFDAERGDTLAELQHARSQLAGQFDAAGLQLASTEFSLMEDDGDTL